jgi:hypothetical protein
MALPERLQQHLKREKRKLSERRVRLVDDYVEKLPRLSVDDDVTLSDIQWDILEDVFSDAGLTKGQKAAVNRLFAEIDLIHYSQGDFYKVTAGDIRKMTNEQLTLLGWDKFHPGAKSVRILRALFGEEEVE